MHKDIFSLSTSLDELMCRLKVQCYGLILLILKFELQIFNPFIDEWLVESGSANDDSADRQGIQNFELPCALKSTKIDITDDMIRDEENLHERIELRDERRFYEQGELTSSCRKGIVPRR